MGVAMLTMLIGLVFAFVLIQEKLAPLLSDTVFVPGYFHFFAVGTITQTFLAAMMWCYRRSVGGALGAPPFSDIKTFYESVTGQQLRQSDGRDERAQ